MCIKFPENWKLNIQALYNSANTTLRKKLRKIYDEVTEIANKNAANLEYLLVWCYP